MPAGTYRFARCIQQGWQDLSLFGDFNRADGIYFKMWPLHWSFRRLPWSEVKRHEAKQYRPLREFGGWGIRWTPGKLAYNVRGNQGVWIERTNGRAILVGSQTPEKFVKAIDEAVQ